MEWFCFGGVMAVWLAIAGFIIYHFATLGFKGAGLGVQVRSEHLGIRLEWSGTVKNDLSVVTTAHPTAPIGVALVQRAPLSISAAGASLTREQALAVAAWLRQAAGRAAYRS